MKIKNLQVAVLRGGDSSERNVSLASAREVIKALKSLGYKTTIYDPKKDLLKLVHDKNKIDVVLPILHGSTGENGGIQGFLETIGLPYAFSGVLASAIGINKYVQHQLFEYNKISTAKYQLIRARSAKIKIRLPFVTKPNCEGSSLGVSICKYKKDISKALDLAFRYGRDVLVEEYLKGTEITVGILGHGEQAKALPAVEIVTKKEFFNYQAKYDGTTDEIVPARIKPALSRRAKYLALKIHRLLGCSGVTRVDMIIKKNKIFVLEINTIPGMTSESLIPKAASAAGMSFEALIDNLVKLALS